MKFGSPQAGYATCSPYSLQKVSVFMLIPWNVFFVIEHKPISEEHTAYHLRFLGGLILNDLAISESLSTICYGVVTHRESDFRLL